MKNVWVGLGDRRAVGELEPKAGLVPWHCGQVKMSILKTRANSLA